MLLTEILPLLLVAVVAANLGQVIYGYSLGRYLVAVIIGFIGASFGMWISRLFGFPELIPFIIRGQIFPAVWSIIGSAALLWLFGPLTHRRERDGLIANEGQRWE